MELIRWNPWREIDALRGRFGSLFGDTLMGPAPADERAKLWNWNPSVDIYENDQEYVISAELPGVDKKDISLDVKGRTLSLKGERSAEKDIREDRYYRRERSYGKFERMFSLPDHVDLEVISADFKDGVLRITIPKSEKEKPRQIAVN